MDTDTETRTSPEPYRLLVTGARDWPADCVPYVEWRIADVVLRALDTHPSVVLVHGANRTRRWNRDGSLHSLCVDGLAERWAEHSPYRLHDLLTTEAHPADWTRFGKSAGTRRNMEMVDAGADMCLAFPTAASVGTMHCLTAAVRNGIETNVYPVQVAARWPYRAMALYRAEGGAGS